MEKSDIELKNLTLKFLREKGSHGLNSGQSVKMVMKPIMTHEIIKLDYEKINNE